MVQHGDELPLSKGLNPAWQHAVDEFRQRVVVPVYGEQDSLSREQWQHLVALCGNYLAWRAETPKVAIAEVLERGRILELVEQGPKRACWRWWKRTRPWPKRRTGWSSWTS